MTDTTGPPSRSEIAFARSRRVAGWRYRPTVPTMVGASIAVVLASIALPLAAASGTAASSSAQQGRAPAPPVDPNVVFDGAASGSTPPSAPVDPNVVFDGSSAGPIRPSAPVDPNVVFNGSSSGSMSSPTPPSTSSTSSTAVDPTDDAGASGASGASGAAGAPNGPTAGPASAPTTSPIGPSVALGAPAARPPAQVVSYGPDASQTITVLPSPTPTTHMVVLVHGGGWRSSPNANLELVKARALQQSGVTVFAANYRSDASMAGAFPTEIDDVITATLYSIALAPLYNATGAHVTLIGGSSGGQLADMAAIELNSASPGTIASVVTLSAPTDFVLLIQNFLDAGGHVAGLHVKNEVTALGCGSAATCPIPTQVRWSPDHQIHSTNCPARHLILNDNAEIMPVQQADLMTQALQAAGCSVDEVILTGTAHAFQYWGRAFPTIAAFVAGS